MDKTLSKYQDNIQIAYNTTNSNLAIDAGPGSGKSFILTLLAKLTPITKRSIFLAFNKSIAEELAKKLPAHIQAMTLHSLGCRTLMKYWGRKFDLKEDKTFMLCKKKLDYTGYTTKKAQNQYMRELCQLYDLYRINLLYYAEELISVAPEFDLFADKQDCANIETIYQCLEAYNTDNPTCIDFVDMLWMCRDIPKNSFPQYDVVLVDECQDLNPLQKLLVDKIKKPGGRFVAVGDPRQCIYSFAGASLDCFNAFKSEPNTITLPLSVTYRCSEEVTKEANKIFPPTPDYEGLECFPGNPKGAIEKGKWYDPEEGDFVLCRNNRPLVEMYIKLLSIDKKATIYGKDYGKMLINMLGEVNTDFTVSETLEFFAEKRVKIMSKLEESGFERPDLHPKVANFDEMVQIIKLLFQLVGSVSETINKIKEMFTNEIKGITLMTVHKSKGLEAENVFFLKPGLIPSKYATSYQMLYAEQCLYFVAVTRAKKNLYYIYNLND